MHARALTSRSLIFRALLAGLLAGCCAGVCAQQRPAPIERHAPPSTQTGNGARGANGFGPKGADANGLGGDHLAEWMTHHRGWTFQEQREALEREPGFRELPGPIQQRYLDHLAQLNAMDPRHRARILALNEAMERLTLGQRSEVRGAMQQLGSLPPDQRQEVSRSFRQLRLLPPDQRMAALNSDGYRGLNAAQRTTLINLLRVEPMLPPPEPPQPH